MKKLLLIGIVGWCLAKISLLGLFVAVLVIISSTVSLLALIASSPFIFCWRYQCKNN